MLFARYVTVRSNRVTFYFARSDGCRREVHVSKGGRWTWICDEDKVQDKDKDMKSQSKASVGFGCSGRESDNRIIEYFTNEELRCLFEASS